MKLHGQVVLLVTDCVGGSSQTAHDAALEAMAYLQRDSLVTSSGIEAAFTAMRAITAGRQ